MRKAAIVLLIICVIVLSGCKDISGNAKANFGTSEKDQKVVSYFNNKYGDMTQKGTPRFLEPLMTSVISDNLPADKVTKYSKDTDKFSCWFVYDNFKDKDSITVEWKYADKVIGTSTTAAGGDFGRGTFTLEKPDQEWPLGKYEVVISGKGASSTLSFEVIDGPTVSEKLPFDSTAKEAGAAAPANPTAEMAWHLSEVNEYDTYSSVQAPYSITWTGKEGEVISTQVLDAKNKPTSSIKAKWTIPPETLVPKNNYEIDLTLEAVEQRTEGLGLEGILDGGIDEFQVLPGAKTASKIEIISYENAPRIRWNTPTGTIQTAKASFTAPEYGFSDSKSTGKITLTISFYHGANYGWRYIYQWTDKPVEVIRSGGAAK